MAHEKDGLNSLLQHVCGPDGSVNHDVRNQVVEITLPLVAFVLRSYVRRNGAQGIDADDLHSCGVLALIRAVEKFDASRGVQFSTYACRCISWAVSTELKRAWKWKELERSAALLWSPCNESSTESVEIADEIEWMLEVLTPLEWRVVKERMNGETLKSIGRDIGVTKQRAQQIHQLAMTKLEQEWKPN